MIILIVDSSEFLQCHQNVECMNNTRDIQSLNRTPLVLYDIRVSKSVLMTPKHLFILNNYHLTDEPLDWRGYQQLIYRLLTNPLEETIQVIKEESEKIGPKERVLGMHIRCAGKLADRKERVAMVTPDVLLQIPNRIRKMMLVIGKPYDDITLYLSTDSTVVERYLRTIFADYRVIVFNRYRRGHTTAGAANYLTIQQAIIDMYLLSQAKSVMYTSSSGFSEAIRHLNTPSLEYTIDVTKSVIE